MNEECRFQIISNDYADFIVDYSTDPGNIGIRYGTECINPISIRNAVVHIPINRLGNNSMLEFGYASFPSCFGLADTSSLEASGINRIQSLPSFELRGQGVLIGIIDTGIDYTNKIFQNADGTTRIVSIWDQTIESDNYPEEYFYGTEYTREQINQALMNEDPYSIVPSIDEIGHGTLLAGIAAGSRDEENEFIGVVPDAEFIVVKLKQAKQYLRSFFAIPRDAICYQENDIMLGVKYLEELARSLGRPIAICIGLGTSQGGHDSRGALSNHLEVIGDHIGVAIAVAAGNEANTGHHYFGEINTQSPYDTMELIVSEDVRGFSMEIWGFAPNAYSIDILSPTGEYIPRIPARIGESREINFLFEGTTILVNYRLIESQTGDQLIHIRFGSPTAGIWRFNVYGAGDLALNYHCWLPITDFLTADTHFVNSNPETTITSPGNSFVPITVTAYDHNTESLFLNAGRGYTRDNMVKPDIAAPGVNVYGPLLNHTYGYHTGTSVAAAQATGVAAMLLEWGVVRNNVPFMNGFEVKNYLIRGARRSPTNIYPNNGWGYGILDIYNTFYTLRGET